MNRKNDYGKEYSDERFHDKAKRFARAVGRRVLEPSFTLYFCMKDPDTPKWAVGVIVTALGYFIMPTDAIPDFTPVVGFSDDFGALTMAMATVAAHVKQEHIDKAMAQMKRFFGEADSEDGPAL